MKHTHTQKKIVKTNIQQAKFTNIIKIHSLLENFYQLSAINRIRSISIQRTGTHTHKTRKHTEKSIKAHTL